MALRDMVTPLVIGFCYGYGGAIAAVSRKAVLRHHACSTSSSPQALHLQQSLFILGISVSSIIFALVYVATDCSHCSRVHRKRGTGEGLRAGKSIVSVLVHHDSGSMFFRNRKFNYGLGHACCTHFLRHPRTHWRIAEPPTG